MRWSVRTTPRRSDFLLVHRDRVRRRMLAVEDRVFPCPSPLAEHTWSACSLVRRRRAPRASRTSTRSAVPVTGAVRRGWCRSFSCSQRPSRLATTWPEVEREPRSPLCQCSLLTGTSDPPVILDDSAYDRCFRPRPVPWPGSFVREGTVFEQPSRRSPARRPCPLSADGLLAQPARRAGRTLEITDRAGFVAGSGVLARIAWACVDQQVHEPVGRTCVLAPIAVWTPLDRVAVDRDVPSARAPSPAVRGRQARPQGLK
jgi:hypothetical protein